MAFSEPFTFIEATKDVTKEGFDNYVDILSAKVADVDLQFNSRLRAQYPEMIVTTVPGGNIDLILFADLGHAQYEIDIEHDSVSRWRGFVPPDVRDGGEGYLGEIISYAKYKYTFGAEYFILYRVKFGYSLLQYILKEPRGHGENPNTHSSETDKLIKAAGDVLYKQKPGIYVYDRYWSKDHALYEEVQNSTWDKVILDENMKKSLVEVSGKFFDSKDVYDGLGVPWKRGLLFHGPPGNGKTISIKALMRTLSLRDSPIPTLYVKSAPNTYYIRSVFSFARRMSPCMLVLEDIETIVTSSTRSYFFNEVDGLENNDGILMVASTNFLERLDPGLSKRPSRFDRKYLFPLPNLHERELYAEYWREKLKKSKVVYPKKLCAPMAKITDGFSFAYMQEAYVASLLDIARQGDDATEVECLGSDGLTDNEEDDFDEYLLWRVFKEQVKILRDDMDSSREAPERDPLSLPYVSHGAATPGYVTPSEDSPPTLPAAYNGGRAPEDPLSERNDGLKKERRAQQFLHNWEKYPEPNPAAMEYRMLNYDLTWMKH
ncbi:hypothetical protein H2200_004564 [Cladophialophora chaetospira]|uniref:ATPase AAA-type core domain-containing protein n=1 Tax=Cladophialophora chaetospira TaxID=386627 RepID=A0AA38XDJ2_9EURO|nr:hypothetical protein H2200_004564 [Cladophialophora chaetospira]